MLSQACGSWRASCRSLSVLLSGESQRPVSGSGVEASTIEPSHQHMNHCLRTRDLTKVMCMDVHLHVGVYT